MKTSKLTRTRSSKHYKMHNSLFRQHSQTLPSEDQNRITEKLSELRNRFDTVNIESQSRTNKLKFAAEDLPKLEEEVDDFQEWLERAEKSLDDIMRTRSSEAVAVRKQYNAMRNFTEDVIGHAADLKFVVKGGQKYLDSAKVYRQDLQVFRESALPRQFARSFNEDPETNIIHAKLGDISKRFEQLKAQGTETNQPSKRGSRETAEVLRDRWPCISKTSRDERRGRNLADSKPDLQTDINRTNGGIVDRYNNLDTLINQRNQQLQSALTQSQDIQDSLESLIRWLDDTERTVHKMEKGTVIVVKRDPLVENLQEQKLIEDDIDGHRAAVEAVTRAATEIMESSEPKLAKTLKNKVDGLKTRYDRLTTSTQNHGKLIQGMTDRLTEFEQEVDALEDWLLPTIDLLESKELTGSDLDTLERKLKSTKQHVSDNKARHKKVHQLGENLLHDRKASDSSYVSAVLTNVDMNWRTWKRAKQLDSKQRAAKKYAMSHKATTQWLDGIEHKVNQLNKVSRDTTTLQTQVEEVKPLKSEVIAYKPKVGEVNKFGHSYDKLLKDDEYPINVRPRYRSLQIGSSSLMDSSSSRAFDSIDSGSFTEEESKIQKELGSVNKRYEALRIKLTDRDEELELAKLLHERTSNVSGLMEWVTVTDAKVLRSTPKSSDVGELNTELETYRIIHSDIDNNKTAILDAIHATEQFLRDKRQKLRPEQVTELQKHLSDLRNQYEELTRRSETVCKESESRLHQLRLDNEEKSLHEDILAHQGPVLESVQEANQLLRQKGDLLAAEDKNAMTDALSNLKSRYENLNVQSSGRVSNLRFALDDLEKVEPEAETLEKWLKDAEQKLETSSGG
ncbi:putative nesprin-1 [Apostichopus japonicus]|uniref:Putative nesprin-1 n=1 Tax=Stichopus japonicus TaxID=307972 RepID=A0A2G8JQI9_STIJA|nr:putative nesprin-1 [Apostichopus japonicus]